MASKTQTSEIGNSRKYELFTLREDPAGQDGHWYCQNTNPYTSTSIAESNSQNTTEPTSIPSPFARMELARTAFAIAARTAWDEVPARYQKIVSDCLDVAEIFFNYPLFSKYFEIIIWTNHDLNNIANTALGKSMLKFWGSDANSYHFNRVNAIYLLNYIGENRPNKTGLNIVGATSPITLFFSVGNDLHYVSETLSFNQDRPFDGAFNPLENRDIAFVNYLNLMRQKYDAQGNNVSFAQDFKEVDDYITAACNRVANGIAPNGTHNYNNIAAGNNNFVEVLGFPLGCQQIPIPCYSDFEIKSSSNLAQQCKPLALPVESGNGFDGCRYINDAFLWGTNNSAPFDNATDWRQRTLPFANVQYPYLTANDFFTDNIIEMPYELNSNNYFDGNIDHPDTSRSYLLPFKPLLFEFFTVEEIREMTKMQIAGTVVKVTLNIPIRNYTGKATNANVKYEKIYCTNGSPTRNEGQKVSAKFGLGVFPLIRPRDVRVAHYRIAMFDKEGTAKLSFYESTDKDSINIPSSRKHRDFSQNACSIETYVMEQKNFDRIQVSINNETGYIIPNFTNEGGNTSFKFAVDLGTTNTHIAYEIENIQAAQAFRMSTPQMVKLHKDYRQDRDISVAFTDCFMPDEIGCGGRYKFPMRSAFAEDQTIDYREICYTLADGNIPFRYEEIGSIPYLDIKTDEELKWTAEPERLSLYIQNIVYMLRNKVLQEGGRLDRTKIVWFYPASMSEGMRSNMNNAWGNSYRNFLDANYNQGSHNLEAMSESMAPYCYFKERDGAVGVVTTIDVGGGTTDVYISDEGGNNGYLSSFRFASNAVFGDGYNNNISNNGFVGKFRPIFADALSNKGELSETLKMIYNRGKSTDLISFFFSLEATREPGLNFMNMLQNDQRYKYLFVYFYTAILYHVANTMKSRGISKPNTVAFSGNGSKTLRVLSTDNNTLSDFVKRIFERVYDEAYPQGVRFILRYNDNNPKEATSLGGLVANTDQINANPQRLILLGNDTSTFVTNQRFDDISNETKDEIIATVKDFIEFVSSLNEDNYFGDRFSMDIQILQRVEDICFQNLKGYLNLGLEKIMGLLQNNRAQTMAINESLFFYPLVGMLNNLAQEIPNL